MGRGMSISKVSFNEFYCTQCGKRNFILPRKKGREREPGHLKKIFCPHCRETVNHVEVKQYAQNYTYFDFVAEYEYGNFDTSGNRIMKYGELKQLINNHKITKVKTLIGVDRYE